MGIIGTGRTDPLEKVLRKAMTAYLGGLHPFGFFFPCICSHSLELGSRKTSLALYIIGNLEFSLRE